MFTSSYRYMSDKNSEIAHWRKLYAAWLISLLSSLAVLFIGEIMGRSPCSLCWYQRTMMFPLSIILGVASYRAATGIWIYALPLAALGWLFALYHFLLVSGVIPETIIPCGTEAACSDGASNSISGVPIPMMSLAAFSMIFVLLLKIRPTRAK